jgi:hypothetical protein
MQKSSFRFSKEFIVVKGTYNIPVYVIRSGFGYGFHTFICSSCGELFVFNDEYLSLNRSVLDICRNLNCPNCNQDLSSSLLPYPEYIFHNNELLKVNHKATMSSYDEILNLEVFEL